MRHLFRFSLACACGFAHAAPAAGLRPFTQITAGTVRLGDLFDNLGATPDRVLGSGPAPGSRIEVRAPQLAAIARDFNVDWRPVSGDERTVIERSGALLKQAVLLAALRAALVAQGAPADADIVLGDVPPVMVPVAGTTVPEIDHCSLDRQSGQFTAVATIAPADTPPVALHLSGTLTVLVEAAVATRRIARGSVIGAGDVTPARVRAALLHGGAAVAPSQAVGMVAKRDVPDGQPITARDAGRPALVQRGDRVRMTLAAQGIALTAQGIARESGGLGDRVHLENPNSHAVLDGEVTGEGEVRVAP